MSRFLSIVALTVLGLTAPGVLLAQSVSVTVSGKEGWQDSGVNVNVGDTVTITATGAIAYDMQGTKASPDGSGGRGPAVLNDDGTCPLLLCDPSVPRQSLVGRIGSDDLKDFKNGFAVGSRHSQTARQSGRLYLGFNDGVVTPDRKGIYPTGVGNNHGSFAVDITVKPRPK